MRIPGMRQAAKVSGAATRTNRTDGRIEKHKDYSSEVPTELVTGDASVSATRGFKHWFSTREAGVTVEATMTVSLSCPQEYDAIGQAAEEAGKMAEKLAVAGCADMDLYIKKFMDEVPNEDHR